MDYKISALHELVLTLFREAGDDGLTDMELQTRGKTQANLRPRRIECTAQGLLKDSGLTRTAPSGRQATVWVICT